MLRATASRPEDQTLFSFRDLERRWPISKDSLKRRAREGALRTVLIGDRRFVPLDEVLRVEKEGL